MLRSSFGAALLGIATVTAALVAPDAAVAGKSASPRRAVLVKADFDRSPTGPMSRTTFSRELGASGSSSAFEDSRVVTAGKRRGKVYRVQLQRGTVRGKPSGNHGVVVTTPLKRKVDNACIRYRVRFSKGFDFSLGGKLPGLSGVAPGVDPGLPAGGGSPGSKGWSARMMWLTPKSYSWAGPGNMAVSYLYGPRQRSTYGDNVGWGKAFKAGRWHKVRQCHKMNTVGRSNGVLRAWFDGRRVLNVRNHVYRTRHDVGISHLMWSVFRGGSTLDWAGSRDGHIDFDNVRITTRR